MEVSGQFHAPIALPPRKESPVPTGWEAGWAPKWTLWRTDKFYLLLLKRKEKGEAILVTGREGP
jgi:hypothetical protein